MIKSIDHALAVQTRRHAYRRVGLAKAIRRYLLRDHAEAYKNMRQAIIKTAWQRLGEAA